MNQPEHLTLELSLRREDGHAHYMAICRPTLAKELNCPCPMCSHLRALLVGVTTCKELESDG